MIFEIYAIILCKLIFNSLRKELNNGYQEKEKNSKKKIIKFRVSLHKTPEIFRGFMFIVVRSSDSIKK